MPAGVTWGAYLKFTAAAMVSMFAGAQTIHVFYQPLSDMEVLVNEEIHRLQEELVSVMKDGTIPTAGVPTSTGKAKYPQSQSVYDAGSGTKVV